LNLHAWLGSQVGTRIQRLALELSTLT
jgi:hypothetical protein